MPPDPAVLAALKAALETNPEASPVRLHLGALLLESGSPADALEQFVLVLSRDPADLEALRGAQSAALALGETKRAEGYRQLLAALAGGHEDVDAGPPVGSTKDEGSERPRLRVIEAAERFGAWEAEEPRTTLADVGGMEDVKRRLRIAFLAPLRNPELRGDSIA